MASRPHSTPKYEGSTLDEILRLAKGDVEGGEQGTRGMYARALVDLEEQLQTAQDNLARCVDVQEANQQTYWEQTEYERGKNAELLEQLETAHAATEDTALAANLFREQRDRLQEQFEATTETFRLIARACGADGTEPDDWRAMTFPSPGAAAFAAAVRLRVDYDEALASSPAKEPKA